LDRRGIEAAKLFTKIATGKEKTSSLGRLRTRLPFTQKGN